MLTPEDGTGLLVADSYVSLADFRAWAAARGLEDAATADDTETEAAMRKAFDKVNSAKRWKSAPKVNEQAGEFPRIDLSDGMGRTWNTVPPQVGLAQNEFTVLALAGTDLFVVAERGGQVQSESVGPISTSYFQGAPSTTFFEAADRLLCRFARDDDSPRSPVANFNDSAHEPIFGVGMDDNTSDIA
jgi:hypothetical protein